jgi:hypothetical protein
MDDKEVFHISNQNYTFEQAKCKCESYGAKLATRHNIIDSYNKRLESKGHKIKRPASKTKMNLIYENDDEEDSENMLLSDIINKESLKKAVENVLKSLLLRLTLIIIFFSPTVLSRSISSRHNLCCSLKRSRSAVSRFATRATRSICSLSYSDKMLLTFSYTWLQCSQLSCPT